MTPLDKLQNFANELPSFFGLAVKKLMLTPIDDLTTAQFQLIHKGLSEELLQQWLELHVDLKLDTEETELLTAWINSPYSDSPHLYEGWKQNEIKRILERKLSQDFGFETL
jgi:hypothetical protein